MWRESNEGAAVVLRVVLVPAWHVSVTWGTSSMRVENIFSGGNDRLLNLLMSVHEADPSLKVAKPRMGPRACLSLGKLEGLS